MPPPTPRTMRFRYSRCIGLPCIGWMYAATVMPARQAVVLLQWDRVPSPIGRQANRRAKRWAKIAQQPQWKSGTRRLPGQGRRAGSGGRRKPRGGGAMSLRDWPAAARPREKLLAQWAASLTDAELLAIF